MDDTIDSDSDTSESPSEHSSDREFLEASSDEWTPDNDLLRASSEHFVGEPGGTVGLKRYRAMIKSLEYRASALEAKRAAKKRVAAGA